MEALVFMFNGGSSYTFTILVYTNHINNEKHMHHGSMAPQAYLCSTSLIMAHRIGDSISEQYSDGLFFKR